MLDTKIILEIYKRYTRDMLDTNIILEIYTNTRGDICTRDNDISEIHTRHPRNSKIHESIVEESCGLRKITQILSALIKSA